jgi:Lon-like ATP-dependent protease
MPHGSNLPWRTALRHASRSSTRIPASRASARHLPAQCTASIVSRYPLRCPSPPAALLAYRTFSTSLSRPKEKDPKAPPPEASEEDAVEKEASADQAELSPERAKEFKALQDQVAEFEALKLEAKNKASESNSPRSGSGRGSAAGGGGDGDNGGKKRKGSDRSLVKSSVPDSYPQVLAIPLVGDHCSPASTRPLQFETGKSERRFWTWSSADNHTLAPSCSRTTPWTETSSTT